MKATIFSIAAILAPAAVLAQTDTNTASSSSSSCAADYIVEQCLTTTQSTQENCGEQDYSCQCSAYEAIVTCFNNCPGDTRQSTYQGLVTQYCALASQYSTTNTVRATATSDSASGLTAATATGTTTGTSTSTASSSSATSTSGANSGSQLVKGAGGVMAAVAGVVAAML